MAEAAAPTGTILATEETFRNVAGFPTGKLMAEAVLPLPALTQGKILSDAIQPCKETGKLVMFAVEHGRGKWFSMKDSYSVLDYEHESFDDLHITETSNIAGKTRIVMKDKEENPIALAVEELLKINKAYFIMSKNPLFDGDAETENESGVSFYPMFKVRDIDDNHLDFRSILIWNGHNYQPFLRIVPAKALPSIAAGRQLVPPRKNDLLLVSPNDLDQVYALMAKKPRSERMAGWDCVVAPGADVGMCMMLAVIMDDMVGWFA